jgi:hypothetical protein
MILHGHRSIKTCMSVYASAFLCIMYTVYRCFVMHVARLLQVLFIVS